MMFRVSLLQTIWSRSKSIGFWVSLGRVVCASSWSAEIGRTNALFVGMVGIFTSYRKPCSGKGFNTNTKYTVTFEMIHMTFSWTITQETTNRQTWITHWLTLRKGRRRRELDDTEGSDGWQSTQRLEANFNVWKKSFECSAGWNF